MWQDALRVCKEYVPHKLQAMQDEYEREMIGNSKRYVPPSIVTLGFIFSTMKFASRNFI